MLSKSLLLSKPLWVDIMASSALKAFTMTRRNIYVVNRFDEPFSDDQRISIVLSSAPVTTMGDFMSFRDPSYKHRRQSTFILPCLFRLFLRKFGFG